MTIFKTIWLGQVVSLVGSGLTSFSLGVWVFRLTGSTTQFALIGLFAVLPRVVFSPIAGTIVDRWDRRWVMIVSDIGAGISTLIIALLLSVNQLEIWHIYFLTGINAAFGTVQWLAYMSTTSLLVSNKNLGRANGMSQFGQAASEILAPALAGVLIRMIQLKGVILIDVTTCAFAVITLLLVRLPKPERASAIMSKKNTVWHPLGFGWAYLFAHPGLMQLSIFLAVVNFIWGMVGALITPLVLSWTSSDVLGMIISIAGAGMLTGSLVMSSWGGPQRRIKGMFNFELLSGVCFMLIGFSQSFWSIALGAFGAHVTIAIVYGSNQAIWQSKVPPDVQGRVFATQQMIIRATSPLAYLLAGPLADKVFEPMLAINGLLSNGLGQIIGIGPGRGIGLMFVIMGLVKVTITLIGQLYSRIRFIEDDLPDVTIVQLDPFV